MSNLHLNHFLIFQPNIANWFNTSYSLLNLGPWYLWIELCMILAYFYVQPSMFDQLRSRNVVGVSRLQRHSLWMHAIASRAHQIPRSSNNECDRSWCTLSREEIWVLSQRSCGGSIMATDSERTLPTRSKRIWSNVTGNSNGGHYIRYIYMFYHDCFNFKYHSTHWSVW